MERETITLSKKEQLRLRVLNLVCIGDITAAEAAQRLRLSLRQIRRLLAAYRLEGADALAHGNRGRKPAVAFSHTVRQQVLERAADLIYAGCNDTHLAELLAEREGLTVSRPTLRRWLRASDRPSPRKRRPKRYRKLRERAPRFGLLLQIDTSFHAWFEDRGPKAALVAAIDDATGQVVSGHFRAQEDTAGYFILLADILRTHGTPGALYHDGRTTFVYLRNPQPSLEEELEGILPQTQFARAASDLGIALIHARSPQAKGRIERLWLTFQDRLRIELRLAGITDAEAANAFLPGFLTRYNKRFAEEPAEANSAFRPLPPDLDPDAICCNHYLRTVTADNTVSIDGMRLQLPPGPNGKSYAKTRVTVQSRLDGSWAIYNGERCIAHPAPVAAPKVPAEPPQPVSHPPRSTAHKLAPTHPWMKAKQRDWERRQAGQQPPLW